jgi:branched-chain amino acid transport system substrate-binding protein
VPSIFPAIAAHSTYEPYNRLKFAQFASYYDQTRAAVRYFAEQRGRKAFCGMYQDAGMGTEVAAGVAAQTEAMGVKVVATTLHKAADTDFNAPVLKLQEAGCDVIILATAVRDTNLIIQTIRRMGMNVDLVGQFVAYDLAVAGLAGGVAEGFFCISPGLYAYPDDRLRCRHSQTNTSDASIAIRISTARLATPLLTLSCWRSTRRAGNSPWTASSRRWRAFTTTKIFLATS